MSFVQSENASRYASGLLTTAATTSGVAAVEKKVMASGKIHSLIDYGCKVKGLIEKCKHMALQHGF